MQKCKIVGREEEVLLVTKLFQSDKAELLALYGRRRVGKTYLITEFFKDRGVFFEVTGTPRATTREQLDNFHEEFCALFLKEGQAKKPKDWFEAFRNLQDAVKKISNQKVVVFLDELPWLANSRSRFLPALEYFWNRHGSRMNNLLLILCGSAASWMIKNVINNRAGLHGRLSGQIRLPPFSLKETERYLNSNHIELDRKQLCELYMTTGGVAKYLQQVPRGESIAQIVNSLCFKPQSLLLSEFHKLYHSLFGSAERHINLVTILAKHHYGVLKRILLEKSGLPMGGRTNDILRELEESDFIMRIPQFVTQEKENRYRLVDEYTGFYLSWINEIKPNILRKIDPEYWIKIQPSQAWKSWSGYAFEGICLKHVNNIRQALSIGGVHSNITQWSQKGSKNQEGAQIDLIIDRADNCINLCEIKFYKEEWKMTKKDADRLQKKKVIFREETGTKKALFTTLITPYGAQINPHYLASVDNQLTIDALF